MSTLEGRSLAVDEILSRAGGDFAVRGGMSIGGRSEVVSGAGSGADAGLQIVNYIEGFGRARFGMSATHLLDVLSNEFGIDSSEFQYEESLLNGERGFVVELPNLKPGPGQVVLGYVLDRERSTLAQVNIIWGHGTPAGKHASLIGLYEMGANLANYFYKHFVWRECRADHSIPGDAASVVLFRGEDCAGAAVEVAIGIVPTASCSQDVERPASQLDLAYLRVSYIATPDMGAEGD